MFVVLILITLIGVGLGWTLLGEAKSTFHETTALICFVIAAITFSAAGIINAIERVQKMLVKQWGPLESEKPNPDSKPE